MQRDLAGVNINASAVSLRELPQEAKACDAKNCLESFMQGVPAMCNTAQLDCVF